MKVFLYLTTGFVIAVSACQNPPATQVPCNPPPLQPFKTADTIPATAASLDFFKQHLARWYAELKYSTFRGRQAALVRNTDGLTGFFINHLDNPVVICRHPHQNKNDRYFRHIDGRYAYYNSLSRQMYMIQNPFDSLLIFTDTLDVEISTDTSSYNYQNEMQAAFFEVNGKASILWNYGLTKRKNINFLDKNIFLFNQNGHRKKIGIYPKNYNKTFKDKRDAFYAMDSSQTIYYALAYSDSVYKMDINGSYLGAAAIAPCRKFDKYAETDLTDLAYKRRYMLGSEQNMALELVDDRYIVILRRKSSLQAGQQPGYIITVFNKQLEKLYHHEIQARIITAIYHYKNTIFFAQDEFKEFYEFKID